MEVLLETLGGLQGQLEPAYALVLLASAICGLVSSYKAQVRRLKARLPEFIGRAERECAGWDESIFASFVVELMSDSIPSAIKPLFPSFKLELLAQDALELRKGTHEKADAETARIEMEGIKESNIETASVQEASATTQGIEESRVETASLQASVGGARRINLFVEYLGPDEFRVALLPAPAPAETIKDGDFVG